MNNITKYSLSVISAITVITGCGENIPILEKQMNHKDKCKNIERQLSEVDEFLIYVDKTSQFILTDRAPVLGNAQISISSNKRIMLKDGKKRKLNLTEKFNKNNCKLSK